MNNRRFPQNSFRGQNLPSRQQPARQRQLPAQENRAAACPESGDMLTTDTGAPIYDTANSETIGPDGPTLLQDVNLIEKLSHFNRERIPERAVHAKGAGAFGYFQPYQSMAAYTKAAFLRDPSCKTKVLVRFSTVIGSRGSADTVRDPRGFAVKFYTEEGNYDVAGLNLPVFFIRDAIKFPDFIHSQKPSPITNLPDPERIWDFFSLSPESLHQITWLYSDRGIVKDFRRMDGFGVHTFIWKNAQGKRCYVKYHFLGQEDREVIDRQEGARLAGLDPDIAVRNLSQSIAAGKPLKFEFCVQIMDPQEAEDLPFDPLDATKLWPEDQFPLKKVGMLVLDRNPENYFAEIEQAAFNPGNLVPGIEFSADKLLLGRSFAYADAQRYRIGTNFLQLPVNRPVVPVNNNQQDGSMAFRYSTSNINYKPNSLAGNMPREAAPPRAPGLFYSGNVTRSPILKTDDFAQPRARYEALTEDEKNRMADAIGYELAQCNKGIQSRQMALFDQVSPDMANRIRHQIMLFETEQRQ